MMQQAAGRCWPLMIDPQRQGTAFVKSLAAPVTTITRRAFRLQDMEYALKLGQSVLLEVGPDMLGAETNAALEHLLLRMFKTSGRGNERTVQILSKGGTAKSLKKGGAHGGAVSARRVVASVPGRMRALEGGAVRRSRALPSAGGRELF